MKSSTARHAIFGSYLYGAGGAPACCRLTAAVVAAVLLGCASMDDAPVGLPQAPHPAANLAISPTDPTGRPKDQDEIFAEIATRVPGYAGTYYDEAGTPVTNLVDLTRAPDAEVATASLVKDGKDGQGPRMSRFKEGRARFS